jgi:transposase
MSMQPRAWPEVPAGTVRVARKAFRKGSLAIRARDELGSWYDDEAFAEAYGPRGKPGISPAQLAMVTLLQFTENLTGRQAADAVRPGWTGSTAWACRWRTRALTSAC